MQPMRAGPSWKGQAVGPTGPDKQIEWGEASVTVSGLLLHTCPQRGVRGERGGLGFIGYTFGLENINTHTAVVNRLATH